MSKLTKNKDNLMKLLWTAKLWLLAAFFGACSVHANEDEASNTIIVGHDPRWLQFSDSGNQPIEVIVDDQVIDECWTNSDSVSNAVKLELKRSGFDVISADKENFPPRLVISAVGYSDESSSCIIFFRLKLVMLDTKERIFGLDNHKVNSIMFTPIYDRAGVLSGGDTDSRLKTKFVELTQAFLLDISKYRIEVLENVKKNAAPEAKQFWESYVLE